MSVGPSERQLLADSARSLFARHHDDARALALRDTSAHDGGLWQLMAEAGWLAARVPEAAGGLEMQIGDCAAIVQEAGRVGASDPLISGCFVPSAALAGTSLEAGRAALTALAEGDALFALTLHAEPVALRGETDPIEVIGAGRFLLVLVDDGAGASIRSVQLPATALATLPDGTPRDSIVLAPDALREAVELRRDPGVLAAWSWAMHDGAALTAVQLAACSATLVELTVEHCRQRVQFGQAISQFQVLRHRMVDMHLALELARTASRHAIASLDRDDPDAALAVHVAKARCSDAATEIAGAAIQLHGAIGFTEESRTAPLLRQAMSLSLLFGTAAQHRSAAAGLLRQQRRAA